MTNLFNYVSLFSGIGGFEEALNARGGRCVMASEIDKHARESYKAIYGGYPAGDVTKIKAEDVPDHDLLVGGFPCQAFSVAGKRRGFDDARGTLFFEAVRIARAKRPAVLLLENVKGLLSHDKGRTLDVMTHTLNEIGYTLDFNVLNSKYFGVPQNRERIFIVAIRDDLAPGNLWRVRGNVPVVTKAKIKMNTQLRTFPFDWPEQKEVSVRLRDILETGVPEKYYLSEDRTAKLIAQIGKQDSTDMIQCGNLNHYGNDQMNHVYHPGGIAPTAVAVSGGGRETKIVEPRAVLTPDRVEKRQNGRRFKEPNEEMFTLTGQDRRGVLEAKQATVAGGNNITHCLVSRYEAGPRPEKGMNTVYIDGYRIRKLTPRECGRLQGFSEKTIDAILDAVSNSQAYKQFGNAVTVNTIGAIADRLIPYINFAKLW